MLFFDLDDTLIDYRASERHGLSSALAETGFDFNEEILATYRRINKALWEAYARGETDAEGVRRLRFERLLTSIGGDPTVSARVQEGYLNHFSSCGVLVEGAEELLARLRDAGYKLGVITNGFKDMQYSRMSAAGLANQFDPVIVSDEVGLKKPDPRIFRLALEQADVDDPEKTVYVGDNPSDDIGGAKDFGMSTIWYRRFRSEESCDAADYTTDDLLSIPGWLINLQRGNASTPPPSPSP